MKARRVKGKGVWRKKALSTEGCQQIRRGREEQLMQLIVWQCCQGTGPGEGPGKNIWAVARAAGLGSSHKFLQLVREGDRLPWQGWHSSVSNFFSLPLEFFEAVCHHYSHPGSDCTDFSSDVNCLDTNVSCRALKGKIVT